MYKTQQYLRYESVYHFVKENENYRLLPSQVAQQTLLSVDKAFKSFFKLLVAKKEEKIDKKISMPKYLPKDGMFLLSFPKDQFKVEGNEVRIIPRFHGRWFKIEYV